MKERMRWAFIIDKDEFVRLSLNKILKKYGFEVAEIEDFSQLERRKKDVKGGMILADIEIEALEGQLPLIKKWNDRLILMSPSITDELTLRLRKIGIQRIIKKPVDPRILRRHIREICFPGEERIVSFGRRSEHSYIDQKGGEGI